jgi:hypothetical protein
MGAPVGLANAAQVPSGLGHFAAVLPVLENYKFQETRGSTLIVKEAAGVCGFITPWNWPLNQIGCKVAPALAAGCTIVLKPSEVAPISAVFHLACLTSLTATVPMLALRFRHTPKSTWFRLQGRHVRVERWPRRLRMALSGSHRNWAANLPTSYSTT